jgi:hypothetical protein
MKDGVDRLNRYQDDQERRVIVDWLTPIDYASQQSDFISRRQEGTGLWLLESDEFQEWLGQSKKTLICPGIPRSRQDNDNIQRCGLPQYEI